MLRRILSVFLIATVLAACGGPRPNPDAPLADLGDFRLGHNVVVGSTAQMVPPSRRASAAEWVAVLKPAIARRFEGHDGERLYHLGVSVDAYALAVPGIPVVVSPKSVLVVSVTVWDDATRTKLNEEVKQFTVFESLSGETVVGSGLTQSKEQQMENLALNAAATIERWLVENRAWFERGGVPVAQVAPAAAPPAN